MGRTRKEVIADLNVALLAAGYSMRQASLKLDLNHSYLSQFMKETGYSPEVLPEDVRLALANLLGLDQNILKIGTGPDNAINPNEGFKAYGKPVAGAKVSERRTTDMRVDDVLQEIGRIKERLDQLEGQQRSVSHKKPRP
jgi:hypothetical protein